MDRYVIEHLIVGKAEQIVNGSRIAVVSVIVCLHLRNGLQRLSGGPFLLRDILFSDRNSG